MLGGDGVRLQGPNARNEIVGNEIGHVGGAGVVLASLDQEGNAGDTQDFADPAVLRRLFRGAAPQGRRRPHHRRRPPLDAVLHLGDLLRQLRHEKS